MSRWMLSVLIFVSPLAAVAGPEDRGPKGWWISAGGGVALGKSFAADGRDAGSTTGGGLRLRVGEEVVPSLSVGLAGLYAAGADHSALFDTALGAFLLDVNWRPWPALLGPVVLEGAVGFGVGQIEPRANAEGLARYEGSSVGAMWGLGVRYDVPLGAAAAARGWTLAPAVTLYWLPAQGGDATRLVTTLIGVDGQWSAGR